jgi:long-subunit acyl-CoA synthetase (AMP-forming)
VPQAQRLFQLNPVIIVMDSNPSSTIEGPTNPLTLLKQWGESKNVVVISIEEVKEIGKKSPKPFRPPTADDVFCLCYTSGTTGNPKGAILTHQNMISTVRAAAAQIDGNTDDVHISYLPLAHIFERMMMLLTLANGGSAGFFRYDHLTQRRRDTARRGYRLPRTNSIPLSPSSAQPNLRQDHCRRLAFRLGSQSGSVH